MKLLTSYNFYFIKVSHEHIFSSQGPCLVVADATALYLSMCRDTVTKYLECVLEKHPNFNTKACKIITGDNHSALSHWQTLLCITTYSRLLVCYVRQDVACRCKDWRCVVPREIDFLFATDSFLASPVEWSYWIQWSRKIHFYKLIDSAKCMKVKTELNKTHKK